MEGVYNSSSTATRRRLVDMHAVQHGYSILCLDAENAYFHAEEDEEVCCWPPKEWVQRYHARGGRVENPWWKLKRQLLWKTESCEEVQLTVSESNNVPSSHQSSDDQEPH